MDDPQEYATDPMNTRTVKDALNVEVRRLRRENERLKGRVPPFGGDASADVRGENVRLHARVEELEDALQPVCLSSGLHAQDGVCPRHKTDSCLHSVDGLRAHIDFLGALVDKKQARVDELEVERAECCTMLDAEAKSPIKVLVEWKNRECREAKDANKAHFARIKGLEGDQKEGNKDYAVMASVRDAAEVKVAAYEARWAALRDIDPSMLVCLKAKNPLPGEDE